MAERIEYRSDIRNAFFKILSSRLRAQNLIQVLENKGNAILFGGSVREYFDHGFTKIPRDFDIVIDHEVNIESVLEQHKIPYKRNRFGGYKINVDRLIFDIWHVDQTWAFKENKVDYKELKDLNETVFFNIDAIFYNLTTQELVDKSYSTALETKKLDIVLKDNPLPDLNMTRAIVLSKKYKLAFSDQLNDYFESWLNNHNTQKDAFETLKEIEEYRYKTEEHITQFSEDFFQSYRETATV